jgi:hypothetical protein
MRRPFYLERLEERTLPSGGDTLATALPVAFRANHTAAVAGLLPTARDVTLYALSLARGDTVTAAVTAQSEGSTLDSLLRVFNAAGTPIAANDNFNGLDPQLTFQAAAAGTYYVGVSATGNTGYDPHIARSGSGTSHGLFDLHLSETNAPLLPDLVGGSFHILGGPAAWGEAVTVNYEIENRAGAGAGPFQVELRLSSDNRIDASDVLLSTIAVPGLAAGAASVGTIRLTLPAAPPPSFTAPELVYLGVRIDPAGAVVEANLGANESPRRGSDYDTLQIVSVQSETEPNTTTATANPIALDARVSGTLGANDRDFFQVTLAQAGRLTAQVHAPGLTTRLSLFDSLGRPLVQSDGQSPANRDDLIVQSLDGAAAGTTYYLKVEGLNGSTGGYTLSTAFQASTPPFQQLPSGGGPNSIITGDFNGDGILDLATADYDANEVSVFLGRGDGTFAPALNFATGLAPYFLASADINADGIPDLITANRHSGDVSILLGNGDGTFQPEKRVAAGAQPKSLAIGDFNGDGHLDIAVANAADSTVSVLLGKGDGTFQPLPPVAVDSDPVSIVTADLNGDGIPDLATANYHSNNVSVLLGNGDGTFQPQRRWAVGSNPTALVAADFNGDRHVDLAVANGISSDVSILLGVGDGTFHDQVRYSEGTYIYPDSIVVGDFNGDGTLDLATGNNNTNDVGVLLGRGDGTFLPVVKSSIGDLPASLVAGDFNGDGHVDLAFADFYSNAVKVLAGAGDGTFPNPTRAAVGLEPGGIVRGDFNGDGIPDLAVANLATNDVSVLLGVGDGTYQEQRRYPAGQGPLAIAAGDFNRDGRLDLAVTDSNSNQVGVLLGLGDGSFAAPVFYSVGNSPTGILVADVNGDGIPDLVDGNYYSNNVSVLLGVGDGTFRPQTTYNVGKGPEDIVAADINGDGHVDLAVANYASNDVSILLGRGDGTFEPEKRVATGGNGAFSLAAGDFNGDGHLDLAVTNINSNNLSVLLGRGDGTFQAPVFYATGPAPEQILAADFNGDGHLDLTCVNVDSNDLSVFLGRGDGTFQDQVRYPVGLSPARIAVGDLNGDGRLDIAVANDSSNDVSVLLGVGDGTFVSAGTAADPIRSTPLVVDLNGDGVPDVAVLSRQGKILVRLGRPGAPGTFDPPVVINPGPQFAARDLAVLRTPAGPVLAALDAKRSSLSFYTLQPDGSFTRSAGPRLPSGSLPVRLVAGDLDGTGRDDLVVADTASDQVLVFLQNASGGFGAVPDFRIPVGVSPTDLALTAMSGGPLLDIVVTDQYSGDVRILRNDRSQPFATVLRYHAGTGPYSVASQNGASTIHSQEGTFGIVAGLFSGGGLPDLVVTNSDANDFSVLQNSGSGFFNAQAALTFGTALRPTEIVAGHFHQGSSRLDLAVLSGDSNQVQIFSGNGASGFTETFTANVGSGATGLSVADVNADGVPDLLVGDEFGDVLVLLGKGDGTFLPYERADRRITLAVADLTGNGHDDIVYADQSLDHVSIQFGSGPAGVFQDRNDGLLAPGAVKLVDLNGDGIPDLVVANSGGNSVLVYLGLGHGQFGPKHEFFVGTNSVGLTVADVNGDGIPDLVVANEGSNDVAVLFGQGTGASWTFVPGQRLQSGGSGPVSTVVEDFTGHGVPDILVSNSQSNDVALIPGVGGGFFNDQNPVTRTTGTAPGAVVPMPLPGDPSGVAVLDSGSNAVTFFPDPAHSAVALTVSSGGSDPVAAVAGDFLPDGGLALLIANNADGKFALLSSGPEGLTVDRVFSLDGVPHPTDLAAGTDPGVLYVTEEGEESADRFPLDFGTAVPAGLAAPGSGGALGAAVADLLPLHQAALATVAVLLTGPPDSGAARGSTAAVPTEVTATVAATGNGPGADGEGPLDPATPAGAANVSGEPAGADVPSFIGGVDDAIRGKVSEMRERLLQPDRPRPAPPSNPMPSGKPSPPLSGVIDVIDAQCRRLIAGALRGVVSATRSLLGTPPDSAAEKPAEDGPQVPPAERLRPATAAETVLIGATVIVYGANLRPRRGERSRSTLHPVHPVHPV